MRVVTGDVATHEFEAGAYDRVVSIELFEHMKNYELLLAKVARALAPGGKLFVHIFAHATTPYDFEDGWMTAHFFRGRDDAERGPFAFLPKGFGAQKVSGGCAGRIMRGPARIG